MDSLPLYFPLAVPRRARGTRPADTRRLSSPACQELRAGSSLKYWGDMRPSSPGKLGLEEFPRMRLFKWMLFLAAGFAAIILSGVNAARSEDIPEEYRDMVRRGLNWMAKEQAPDGHWEAFGGQYPITMTGIGGMSLLMEGSTIREGKYKDRIKK